MRDASVAPEAAHMNPLAAHRLLMRFALALGNVFAWIFLFRGFYLIGGNVEIALIATMTLYLLVQGIVIVLTPLSGAALRHGVRRALAFGSLAAVFAFLSFSLAFARQASESAFGLVVCFIILFALHRALYWVPYRSEIARTGAHVKSTFFQEMSLAAVPLVAALIIESPRLGPDVLLILASTAALLSLFPLTHVSESYEGFEWGFIDTFRALFLPSNRGLLSLSFLDGIQGVTLLLMWPLAAFIIIGQSFLGLGFILTLTLILAPFVRTFVRNQLRRWKLERSVPILATIMFSSWIVRFTTATPLGILVADIYYQSGFSPRRFSVDAHTHDQSADGAHYIDEYTALKEIGMAIGRMCACSIVIIIALLVNATVAFGGAILLAAGAAAYSVILSDRLSRGV